MTATVTLDGKAVLANEDATWTLAAGVAPSMAEFSMRPGDASALLAGAATPIEYRVQSNENVLQVRGLYAIRKAAGPNPKEARVVVADRRFWWPYAHIRRRYNVRRRVGTKRLESEGDVRELSQIVQSIQYAPFSLFDGKDGARPWTAREILDDVLAEVTASEPKGALGPVDVDPLIEPLLDSLPVENLEIDDAGPEALARVLAHIPEAQITVDRDGAIRIYSRADGQEDEQALGIGFEIVGAGHLERVNMDRARPRELHIYFDREPELRIDAEELELGSTTDRDTDGRWADNVLPVPDYTLTLTTGETVAQGTWITFSQALSAWNALGGVPGIGELNFEYLRRASVPYFDLWTSINANGALDPDADWVSRVAAMQAHYRKTYRVNRRVMDRLLSIRAHRVATLDPTMGTRAPATAYSDYAIIPSMRTRLLSAGARQAYVINCVGWPESGLLDSTTKPAPAELQVVDSDQGIVSISWGADASRAYRDVLPSQIETLGTGTSPGVQVQIPGPSGDLTNRSVAVAWDATPDDVKPPALTGNHRLAFIITASPASPNSDAQMQRVIVKPEDVTDIVPSWVATSNASALGPVMEVYVGTETARMAWLDSAAARIDAMLGIEDLPAGDDPSVDDLVVNLDSEASGAASLNSIARAYAASVYALYANRVEGAKATDMQPNARPQGRTSAVRHTVATDGRVITALAVPAPSERINPFAFLPDSTRRILMRLVQPGA